jgi:tripartite-type tricarboxylate transporter receptor subunit TctC
MSERLGQLLVIDDRPGANGQIATELAAKSPPDGYTIILATSSAFTLNPNLGPVPYDPVRSFAPVSLVCQAALLLVVHPSLPARTVQDVIRLAKAHPGRMMYGSNGIGSLSHLTTELFKQQAGIDITHVAYKGGTPAVIDTISGQVSLTITALPTLMTQVRAGKLRAIAVTSLQRSRSLPEVPTVDESGLKGFNSVQWYAFFGPAGLPGTAIQRLNAATATALKTQDVGQVFLREGLEAAASSPEELATFLATDLARWAKVIKTAGMRRE